LPEAACTATAEEKGRWPIMKVVITNIRSYYVDASRCGEDGLVPVKTSVEVSYDIIKGFVKFSGSTLFTKNIDDLSIKQLEEKIEQEVMKALYDK
jgi:hypothetical protein